MLSLTAKPWDTKGHESYEKNHRLSGQRPLERIGNSEKEGGQTDPAAYFLPKARQSRFRTQPAVLDTVSVPDTGRDVFHWQTPNSPQIRRYV